MATRKLDEKVALVTGASSGIGEAIAIALAEEGSRVAVAARRSDRLEALAGRIGECDGKVLPIVADVVDEAQTREMVRRAQEKWGRVDILVNNAGVMQLHPIDGADTSEWRRMVDTNLMGLMYVTQAVLPTMKAQKGGHIVNISSVGGRVVPVADVAVYCATKFGVGAFSQGLRKEVYKDNIRVTVIEPGAVDTELTEHTSDPEVKQGLLERYAAVGPLRAADVAAAVVYALTQPPHVNVNEIMMTPIQEVL